MILVTGATGLVGSHLLLRLIERDEVVRGIYRDQLGIEKTKNVFDLYNKQDLFEKIEWVEADITDVSTLEDAFKNVAFVYHCAALISFDPKDEQKLRKINIEGTANIVNFCIHYKVKKLCHVSSIAALGDLKENETVFDELTEWNPEKYHSDYAISKYGAEMEIWRGEQEGLQTIIVNPGVILGPGFWKQGSGVIFDSVANGLKFYTNGTSGYVSVIDVVNAMVSLMNSEIHNNRFVLIDNNYSFRHITATIAKHLNVPAPKYHANYWLTELGWRLDYLVSFLLNKEQKLTKTTARIAHDIENYSNQKIMTTLNFNFETIDSYIKKIAEYYSKK